LRRFGGVKEARSGEWESPAEILSAAKDLAILRMVRPERFELPTFWFVDMAEGLRQAVTD
jgi:hypothetical protein